MKKNMFLYCKNLVYIFVFFFFVGVSFAREQIKIFGSSTVFPYAKIVADSFHDYYPEYRIPVIGSGGTGAGIKEFCRGVGENYIDIANASRPIKQSELSDCFRHGVKAIEEIRFGYDGIIFASDINSPNWDFSPSDLYKALAKKIVFQKKLIDNPYNYWDEIDKKFPHWPIILYIPAEKHGTREIFEEKVLAAGCKDSGSEDKMKSLNLDKTERQKMCIMVRKDGKAVDISGDYSETLARIMADKRAIGVFGLSFYENNADRLRIAKINHVIPSKDTIAKGMYPIARPLFFYIKKAHIGVISGLKDFVEYFLSESMIDPESPLADYGLVAMSFSERVSQRKDFDDGKIMKIK